MRDSHAPGWRGRPVRYGPIQSMNEALEEGARLERFASIGCAIGLAIVAFAVIVVWAEPAIAWLRAAL